MENEEDDEEDDEVVAVHGSAIHDVAVHDEVGAVQMGFTRSKEIKGKDFDEKNILLTRRQHPSTDYVMLSWKMFGGLTDGDDESENID